MIRLQRITTADTDLYSYMEKLMTQSFPSEEYRELEELRKYTDTKTHFYNNIIFHNNTPVGLITYWDFGHFYYIEHFAIDPAQRNGGYGKSVLNHLCQLLKHPIVLEVEIPQEEMAKRMGITQAGYAQIEAAKRPRKATLEKAAAAMGITLDQLAY